VVVLVAAAAGTRAPDPASSPSIRLALESALVSESGSVSELELESGAELALVWDAASALGVALALVLVWDAALGAALALVLVWDAASGAAWASASGAALALALGVASDAVLV
jgi:hypothetical protein